MRSPSAASLQRAVVAAVAGAGIALVGLSVSGFAGLDSTLQAATERLAAPVHQQQTFRSGQPVRDCPRHRATDAGLHQPT